MKKTGKQAFVVVASVLLTAVGATIVAQTAKPKRINQAIELLAEGQPIYYTGPIGNILVPGGYWVQSINLSTGAITLSATPGAACINDTGSFGASTSCRARLCGWRPCRRRYSRGS